MLPFSIYGLNFSDISAIDDGYCMVFRDAWVVSPLKYNFSNSPLSHSCKRRSNASWWSGIFKRVFVITNSPSV